MELVDAFKVDLEAGSGRAIPIVLGEMKDQAVARDLHIDRSVIVESVLPVEVKTGVVNVELAGFLD
jgi:hypothetical protein